MEEHILDDCIGADSDSGQRYCASRLIRTEVNYFSNQGIIEGYKQSGIDRYRFLATLDLKTSEICRRLDGKAFNVDEAQAGVNLPPMHPFCRSVTVPYESIKSGTRRARDPITGKGVTVPADMTFNQWYDKFVKDNAQALTNERKIKNISSDAQQYKRYIDVLGADNMPKDLDKFQEIKYNNIDEWNRLKQQYRVINQYKIDSGYLSSQDIFELDKRVISEKRNNFKSEYKNSGNIAGMYVENEKENLYLSHSLINKGTDFESYKGECKIITLNDNRQFEYTDVLKLNGELRKSTFYDSEAKIFEYLATIYENKPFKSVTLLSERGMCDSCRGIMEQFKEKYNVTVNAVSNKKTEGNVWKYRWRNK